MSGSSRIIIAGGSGAIGKTLRKVFSREGLAKVHESLEFTVITRSKKIKIDSEALSFLTWEEIEKEGLPDCKSLINLTGANIMESKWSKSGPVYSSRINTTRTLCEAMKKNPPLSFVSASAVGIYETNTEKELDEKSQLLPYEKMNFPQQLVYDWEQEAKKAPSNVKTTLVRVGFVVGPDQNGIKAMTLPLGIVGIGRMGSGKQPFPWIHEEDLCEMMFHAALDPNSTGGIINGVAPQIITQEQFSIVFNRAIGTRFNIPVPGALLKLIGEKSTLLLEGPRVIPKEISNVIPSFQYKFKTIHSAMEDIEQKIQGIAKQTSR